MNPSSKPRAAGEEVVSLATSAPAAQHVGLKEDAVSLWGDFVVSIANVAPSSSVAYTLALLVAFAVSRQV
jgi:hypothetical protein